MQQLASSRPAARWAAPTPSVANARTRHIARVKSGGVDPFNEGATQVRRLVNRDRKEFLGNEGDILDKYTTEFGLGQEVTDGSARPSPSSANAAASQAQAQAQAQAASSTASAFKAAAPVASPFGDASPFVAQPQSAQSRRIEPRGLSPTMAPDPVAKETPIDFIKSIPPTAIVFFFTFGSMIGLMLATFKVVLDAGGVRLAGVE